MALTNQKQVEAFADKLTECSDSIHARLIKAIKKKEVSREEAQQIFQDESIIRQQANSLYIDAALCVVDGLEETQKSLIEVIDKAKDEIRKIKKVRAFIDLVVDLLVLASAAYAGKPQPILAAFKEVKKDIGELDEKDK